MKQENYELITRLQANDRAAFASLYEEYSHRIYLNALKITKDTVVAQDVVQDVFIILWEKRLTLDPAKPILNWIFVVSYNKSIDHLKKALRTSLFSEIELFDGQNRYADKAEPIIKEKRLNLIESAVARLSPQKKRVFEICKLRGKTYEFAAEEMQISKHTVKEYLSEAMKSIRTFVLASQEAEERF